MSEIEREQAEAAILSFVAKLPQKERKNYADNRQLLETEWGQKVFDYLLAGTPLNGIPPEFRRAVAELMEPAAVRGVAARAF
jgi:hypothetical protein